MIFVLIDCSGSMKIDNRMMQVDDAMEYLVSVLRRCSKQNAEIELCMNVMCVSDDATWMYDTYLSVDSFIWYELTPKGESCFGKAYMELEKTLGTVNVDIPPILMMIGDGYATDDTSQPLLQLKANSVYDVATKIAISLDSSGDEELLDFIGTTGSLIKVDNLAEVTQIIETEILEAIRKQTITKNINVETNLDVIHEVNSKSVKEEDVVSKIVCENTWSEEGW